MYLTEAYLQSAFGADQVAALCPTEGELSVTIELAEAAIESALLSAGYSAAVPSSVYAAIGEVPKAIKLAAYGAWLMHAHGRHSLEVPVTYALFVKHFEGLQTGKLEVPGVPKDTVRAVGGVDFTATEGDDGRPPVFTRKAMEGY